MRKPIIAGNWKMNMSPTQTAKLISELKPMVDGASVQVVVCPMSACLFVAKGLLEGSNIALGAQNMHFEDSGAYTGELNADSLLELGVEYVILGHSERRQYFGETDEIVNKKVLKALEKGLKPIICVGELLEQKQNNITDEVVSMQTKLALKGVMAAEVQNTVIAYEPVWAIGTGLTATPQEANSTIATIRKAIFEMYGEKAQDVRIQYGGSMNAGNASELMSMSEIDGGLIGGASLKAKDFSKIVYY